MYTVVYEVYRKDNLSHDEMVAYWLNEHRPIAMKMPNLRGYEIWPVREADGVEGEEVSGFVILRFDTEEDFHTAHESPEFAATREDAKNFLRRFTRYAVDTHRAL